MKNLFQDYVQIYETLEQPELETVFKQFEHFDALFEVIEEEKMDLFDAFDEVHTGKCSDEKMHLLAIYFAVNNEYDKFVSLQCFNNAIENLENWSDFGLRL